MRPASLAAACSAAAAARCGRRPCSLGCRLARCGPSSGRVRSSRMPRPFMRPGTAASGLCTATARPRYRQHRRLARPPAADAAAAVPGEQLEQLEQALVPVVPRAALLRPFRSHVCVRAGEAEFCMLCFTKAPRYRVAAWRQECCDGAAPIGSCPKHFLAATIVCRVSWPPRHEGRCASIDAAAKAWQDGHVLRQLRPPKRRVPAR